MYDMEDIKLFEWIRNNPGLTENVMQIYDAARSIPNALYDEFERYMIENAGSDIMPLILAIRRCRANNKTM